MNALGRRVRHDEQSRQYQARLAAAPQKVLWAHRAPILDQGDLGQCTGASMTQLLNTTTAALSRRAGTGSNRYLSIAEATKLYSRATQLDGDPDTYPPTDCGSDGLAVAKAATQAGFFGRYDHAFGFDQFTKAIVHAPAITGTTWFTGMFTPDAAGFVWPTGKVAGGHEYLVLGYDPTVLTSKQGKVTFLNSWGATWGRNGRFYMRGDIYAQLLADQGDITIPALKAAA